MKEFMPLYSLYRLNKPLPSILLCTTENYVIMKFLFSKGLISENHLMSKNFDTCLVLNIYFQCTTKFALVAFVLELHKCSRCIEPFKCKLHFLFR